MGDFINGNIYFNKIWEILITVTYILIKCVKNKLVYIYIYMSSYYKVNEVAQKKKACLYEHVKNANFFNVSEFNLALLE
jgi:hypothetical protein